VRERELHRPQPLAPDAEVLVDLGDARRHRDRHVEPVQALDAHVAAALVGGGESEPKGARVLLDAARRLADLAEAGRFRLILFGHVDPMFRDEARATPGVELGERFRPDQLDEILDGVDVGIMPSVWEEAYGYAGMEFIAKGIPVIANAIGGMVDYVRDGETGWLNETRDADGLAAIMRAAIESPQQVADLNASIRARRDELVKPIARHSDELDALYEELIAARSGAPAPS